MSKLFTVKDAVSNICIPPFSQPTVRDAKAGFKMVSNDQKTNYYKFPTDFSLILLGSFDERIGVVKLQDPDIICTAAELIDENQDQKEI